MKINKRRYKGFNKRSNAPKIRVFTIILSASIIGGYGYIKLKDKDILNNFSIVKNIGDKFDNISLKNILKIENKSTTDEYNYEDVSKEIEALNENDEEATEVQVATIDAMNVYIVQVASIGGNQDLKSIEEKLKSNKIPYSVVEVDGVEKVQAYYSFDESVTRSNLDSARKVFSDAFVSELKIPVLSLEYTSKYSYISDISTEINNLIKSFKEECDFWQANKESINIEQYNKILTNRVEIVDKIKQNAEKIDYKQMDIFKDNLIEYAKNIQSNTSEASKNANEDNLHLSQGLLLSSIQGYYSFINSIKVS